MTEPLKKSATYAAVESSSRAKNISATSLADMKRKGLKITMLTAYDYPTARLADEAGIDCVLVGDSVAMTKLGYENTLPVTMDEMLHHVKAVRRGLSHALLVADMPYLSYEVDAREAARNAGRFLKEGGAQAVKIEGGIDILPSLKAIVQCQIPVIGHIGLTPQSIHRMGGYKVQGRKPEDAERILHEAKALENAGACAIVLECVPAELAKHVTHHVQIPTIGIGAGADCDGQVLVSDDMLGLTEGAPRKFVKGFADLRSQALQAMSDYCREVRDGTFPGPEHTFSA